MSKKFGFFMAAAVFVLAVVLGACSGEGLGGGVGGGGRSSNTGKGGGSVDGVGGDGGDTLVNDLFLNNLVTAPVEDGEPDITPIDTDQYTGEIAWQDADGEGFTGNFARGAVYTAVLTLTAKPDFTFSGLAANSFVYTGAIAVTNAANSGTVTITFSTAAVLSNVSEVGNYLANAPGGKEGDPIPLLVQIDVGTDWGNLLSEIKTANKKVALDLSGSTMSDDGEFNLGAARGSEEYIVSLVLPDAAESIKDGTGDDPTFGDFTALKSVSGKNVQTVGMLAFAGTSLTTVDFPAATSIGTYAFFRCTSLTTVNLPKATEIIGNAFQNCQNLKTVYLPEATSIGNQAFADCTSLTTVNLPEATFIDNGAFAGSGLTTVNLPVATSIGGGAFVGTSLTTVDFPAAATIGYQAFTDCTSLTTVTLPEATLIDKEAFRACTSLTTVTLPKVKGIPEEAFKDCTSLTTVTLPKVTDIGGGAFAGAGLTTVDLSAATSIGGQAFRGCKNLVTVSLPAATSIDHYAFTECTSLTTVTLPEATDIGEYAFKDCTSLTTVTLPKVTGIPKEAFKDCTSLETVSLPAATSIGEYAFRSCRSLTTVNLPVATDIGDSAFEASGTQTITITLGAMAPRLEYNMFEFVEDPKTVIVKVPAGTTTGYKGIEEYDDDNDSDVNWGNGFRGKGWDGEGFVEGGMVNTNISLEFQYLSVDG